MALDVGQTQPANDTEAVVAAAAAAADGIAFSTYGVAATPDIEAAIIGQMEQMGFAAEKVRAALGRLGSSAAVEEVLEALLAAHPTTEDDVVATSVPIAASSRIDDEVVVTFASSAGTLPTEPQAKRAKTTEVPSDLPPKLLRGLSCRSQQLLERLISRHAGISHAAVARLLLRATAALRQGLLTEGQRQQLLGHLEAGHVDLVQEIVAGVGVRSEPSMPLETNEAAWDCPVCFSQQDEHGWHCPKAHRYCSDCMRHHVQSTTFPKCPTIDCSYEFCETDLQLLQVPQDRLEAFRRAKLSCAIEALGSSKASNAGNTARISDTLEMVVHCPNPNCGNAVLVPQRGRFAYTCCCGCLPFCTHCGQSPYHYHGACSDVQSVRKRWLEWISGGRDDFHGRARSSAAYDEQARALREGIDRHQQLEADEDWKAKHCRNCPSCGKTVQKLSGCDSMTCGTDAHGGNTQPGCGNTFSWSEAPRYRARVETRELPSITTEEVRCRGRDTLHAFVDCSVCGTSGRGIRGPRFRCLHCQSFDVCSDCEPRLGELHERDHVFAIMLESDFDWGSTRLPLGTRVRLVRRGDAVPLDFGGPTQKRLESLCGVVSRRKRPRSETPRQYQFQGGHGRWYNYSDEANAVIVAAAHDGHTHVNILINGTRYAVDLARMRQTNLATRGGRIVRAAPPDAESRAAQEVAAKCYSVTLDVGGVVFVAPAHVEPILASRSDAEDLMKRAMAAENAGDMADTSEHENGHLEEEEEESAPSSEE